MTFMRDLLSRRSLLSGGAIAATAAVSYRLRTSRAEDLVEHGDCSVLPALEWYRLFVTGDFLAIPTRGLGDGSAYDGWMPVQTNELGPVMIPPDWSGEEFFANQFERDGTPMWQQTMLPHPNWSALMLTSPRQDAIYMHITGRQDGPYLDSPGAADLARDLAIGFGTPTEPLCLLEQYTGSTDLPTTLWMAGETFDDNLLMSHGQAIGADFGGFSGGSGSSFVINVFVSPIEESADYMQFVYVPFLWQLLPKGGGGESPTPTPSPTP